MWKWKVVMIVSRIEYTEISRGRISETRQAIISNCSKGGFTVAQQLETKEGDKVTTTFLKGALHIEDLACLYNLRDAINLAIKITEEKKATENDEEWDDK
jgi:hypothetical protein